jgi:hypothetical protein
MRLFVSREIPLLLHQTNASLGWKGERRYDVLSRTRVSPLGPRQEGGAFLASGLSDQMRRLERVAKKWEPVFRFKRAL